MAPFWVRSRTLALVSAGTRISMAPFIEVNDSGLSAGTLAKVAWTSPFIVSTVAPPEMWSSVISPFMLCTSTSPPVSFTVILPPNELETMIEVLRGTVRLTVAPAGAGPRRSLP